MKKLHLFFSLFFVLSLVLILNSCAKAGDNTVRQAMQAYGAGQYETALQFFTQALGEDTNYSKEILYTFIANTYANQGEYKKAIESQEKSLSLREDYRGYVTLGMLYHLVKNDKKAIDAYENAIRIDEKKGEAYASLGALYLGQSNASKAIILLEKAASLEQNIAVIQANLAIAYAMIGDMDKSEIALAKARQLKCENIESFEDKIDEIKINR